MSGERPCHRCGKSLTRRAGERPAQFARRRFCDQGCSGRGEMRLVDKFWAHVPHRPADGCWLWSGSISNGYGVLCLPTGKWGRATRMAWEIYTGRPPPSGVFVCHRCDNPPCVRREHLFLGGPADNNLDAARKGRLRLPPTARGAENSQSKLDDAAVLQIFERATRGESCTLLGRAFGVSERTARNIRDGRRYALLTGKSLVPGGAEAHHDRAETQEPEINRAGPT